ncbi:Cys-tRNA(Pro) deacylase [Thiomicrorhabdus sp.]|uniref:Cys-tRNA(Pro) deacylase n=1 Tax=Thiomicrorhabdus sp. TaxID=2039724 RepID=UPI0029C9160F|nr:Cys-tRNA(Pro) deacylase [Thiomicrorhabdus sp.]
MTPAIVLLKTKKIAHKVHEYQHEVGCESFGLEASQKLGIPEGQVFKTLVVSLNNGSLAVGIVPVSGKLNLKSIAKATGAKKAEMAAPELVERSTGYVLGGVSPLGQKKRLKTVLDSSAREYDSIFVSGGRRGVGIELNPDELLKLLGGNYADIKQA